MLLWERHSNCIHPGKLLCMAKDYFYTGLRSEHQPMVVHLKDCANTTPLQLLMALQENEQNDAQAHMRYPPKTSAQPSSNPRP